MQTIHDDMEVCSTVTTRKLSSLAKLILFTIQKVSDASRHKLLTTLDPQLLAKRGKILRNGSRKPLINKRQRQAYIRYNTLPKVRDSVWDRHVAAAVFPDVASSAGTMDSCHVDRAAEEFIQRFHRQLRLQRWMMAQEV
ncbi:unnamed protein product [Thlaspi arvense]|uniref:Uncharacterized protein n=1 Tax=Thlaspi arvense TaxID=13288 RepID=A0AAU9T1E3_THLAR|nr:unnamed protein product [Thlaspi arvense]